MIKEREIGKRYIVVIIGDVVVGLVVGGEVWVLFEGCVGYVVGVVGDGVVLVLVGGDGGDGGVFGCGYGGCEGCYGEDEGGEEFYFERWCGWKGELRFGFGVVEKDKKRRRIWLVEWMWVFCGMKIENWREGWRKRGWE